MRQNHQLVGLDELLLANAEPVSAKRPLVRRFAAFLGAVAAVSVGVGCLAAPAATLAAGGAEASLDYWDRLPTELPLDVALPQHTILLDKNGKEFARFFSENRIDVPLDSISPNFIDALIATEDSRFYEHGGVDPTGVARAFMNNVSSGERQGASTITQQLVQNILINNARDEQETTVAFGSTYNAKLRELKYAIGLEEALSKDEILATYANTVYFGNGAYGVQAASITYFDKAAKDLTVAEGAMLAGLLKGPAVFDPITAPEAALDRRNTVISRLEAEKILTAEEAAAAAAEPVTVKQGRIPSGCAESTYPFYCQLVKEEILSDPAFGDTAESRQDRLTRGGMILTTALDPKAMGAAQTSINEALANSSRAALGVAVVEPGTGRINAVAQNRDWGTGEGQTEIVYAATGFQPGSSMKPITLATALEQGIPATTKLITDSPYTSPTLDSPPGGFINYGNVDYGAIDARTAIKMSANTYFIQLIQRTGVLPVADMADRLGIILPREGDRAIGGMEASLTLGAYEVTPLEMANAYATFVGNGINCRALTITSGTRADGEPIPTPDPDCHQAIAPAVANTVADALKMPFETGGTLGELGGLAKRPSGAKTGTTNDFAANWIVGVTPQYSTAVWLGDPRGGTGHPLDVLDAYGTTFYNLTGSEVAAPVWKSLMNRIHEGLPVKPMPRADDSGTSSSTARTVPDVRGLGVEQAAALLLASGITATIAEETADAGIAAPGTVAGQNPSAGSAIGYGTGVELTLSAGSDTGAVIKEATAR